MSGEQYETEPGSVTGSFNDAQPNPPRDEIDEQRKRLAEIVRLRGSHARLLYGAKRSAQVLKYCLEDLQAAIAAAEELAP